MGKVAKLAGVRRKPHAPLVEALEQFLQEAKDGEIRGIVGVIETGHSSQHFQVGEFNKSREAEAIIQMLQRW